MKESQIIKQWEEEARARGKARGRAEGMAEVLLHVMEKRFKQVPKDLRDTVLAIRDADRLLALADAALSARTLRRFREQAGV
jgi:hypothetical protein